MSHDGRAVPVVMAGLLALTILLLAAGCIATSATPPTGTPTPRSKVIVVSTRLTASNTGILREVEGCLLLGSQVLAWPPEFEIARNGGMLRVIGGFGKGEIWEFPIGAEIIIGGGESGRLRPEDLDQLRVPPNCAGREYWIFGGGTPKFQVTPQTP